MKKQLFEKSRFTLNLLSVLFVFLLTESNIYGQCSAPPVYTSFGGNAVVLCEGSATTPFTLNFTGATSFQWQRTPISGAPNYANVPGQTTNTLSLTNITKADEGTYRLVATNACGSTNSANTFQLQVRLKPVITTQAEAAIQVCQGNLLEIRLGISGNASSLAWYKDDVLIPGQTTIYLSISDFQSSNVGQYHAVIQPLAQCAGFTATSSKSSVSLATNIAFATQPPASQNVCEGSNLLLDPNITGTANSFQWRKGGNNIVGATNSTYSINNVNNSATGNYSVVVRGACNTLTSGNYAVIVNSLPSFTTSPINATKNVGETQTFTATATGTVSSYKWQKGDTELSDGGNISGSATNSLTLNNLSLTDAGQYKVKAFGAGSCLSQSVTSNVAILTITDKPSPPIITAPTPRIVCQPNSLTLTANCSTGSVVWSNNSTSTTITLSAVGTYAISAKCSENGKDSDASSITNLEIKAKPNAPTITPPTNLIVCQPNSLTLTANCSTGSVVWSNNSTGTTITISAVGTYAISAKCINNGCESDASATTNLEIKAKPNAPTITPPTNLIVCQPNSLTLTANCSTGSVMWSNNSTGTTITISAVGTYAISAKCINNGCESDASATTNLEIKAKPNAPIINPPANLIVCQPNSLTLTANCSTGSVMWSNNSTGTTITISAVGTYAISAKCINNGCESDVSATTNLEIKAKPNAPTITPPTNLIVCQPNSLTLTANCSTGSIMWSNNTTSTTITISEVGTYAISAKCINNGCESDASEITNLEIKTLPNTQVSNTGPYEVTNTIQLNASEGVSYSWSGPNGFSSIQQNPSIFNAQPSKAGIYTVSVTSQSGCIGVATTLVTVNTPDPCIQILQYSYVLSGNPYQYLFALTDGMSINQNTQPTSIMVRPVCTRIPVESVTMQLSNGTRTWETIQNVEPFAVFDNAGTEIRGEILPVGTYTLTITGYAQDNKMGGIVYGPVVTTFTIIGSAPTISQTTISKTEFCAGSTFEVGFTTTGNFLNGNLFQVILSDKDGKFDNSQVIGTNNTTTNISCTIPQNIEYGDNYKLRIISTAPSINGLGNSIRLTIHSKDLSLTSPKNDVPFGTSVQKATDTITASNNHTGEARITYQAGKSILFLPGFNVSNVSPVFKAEIKACE